MKLLKGFIANLMNKTYEGKNYYALICDTMICGVYSTKGEAEKDAKEVKGCVAKKKHKIIKCDVVVKKV